MKVSDKILKNGLILIVNILFTALVSIGVWVFHDKTNEYDKRLDSKPSNEQIQISIINAQKPIIKVINRLDSTMIRMDATMQRMNGLNSRVSKNEKDISNIKGYIRMK